MADLKYMFITNWKLNKKSFTATIGCPDCNPNVCMVCLQLPAGAMSTTRMSSLFTATYRSPVYSPNELFDYSYTIFFWLHLRAGGSGCKPILPPDTAVM